MAAVLLVIAMVTGLVGIPAPAAFASKGPPQVTWLTADDFAFGTYVIDQPGIYRLAEDISFNPNSPATLTEAIDSGVIPTDVAAQLGLTSPVDAYHAGIPLVTQFQFGPGEAFTPGGPLDARYDPEAYGIGFFAALAITTEDVTVDLNGHTLEQHPEHALLQRFFAVIELADQPFLGHQGPASFGDDLDAAKRVTIKNGTIGLSSHHGVHGNGNVDVKIRNVQFDGYEVAAVALNGVDGLSVRNVTATNRKDVPVLGTFSSARFLQPYVDELVRKHSQIKLEVNGVTMSATDIRADLVEAINNTHHDLVASPNIVDGRPQVNRFTHPDEYALFNNPFGVIDGNSYSFVTNHLGVAVDGFPTRPDGVTGIPSRDIVFRNVAVVDQQSFINEVPALDAGGSAAIDAVGAVFQVWNRNPHNGAPITISDVEVTAARYVGNVVANAQALVAKAVQAGEFDTSHLSVSRLNITEAMVNWVEGKAGFETLAAIDAGYLCNGDSMFHVNKGTIAYKLDSSVGVRLRGTSIDGLSNLGSLGSDLCGDYAGATSHPAATLYGYGGATTRGYTFSGSTDVLVNRSRIKNVHSEWGSAIGFDVLTDTSDLVISRTQIRGLVAGHGGPTPLGNPTAHSAAYGVYIGAATTDVKIVRACAKDLEGRYGNYVVHDESASASVVGTCK